MVERDYDVVYKSRVLDRDEERPRIPTALNPFDSPYGAEPRRRREYGSRGGGSRYDDASTTEVARSTTKTIDSKRHGERDRIDYADDRRPSRAPTENMSSKRSVLVDQERDDVSIRRSKSVVDNQSNFDRRYIDLEVDKSRGQGREYYVDDRPRPMGAPYVIDARDVIEVIVPGRLSGREYEKDERRYRFDETRLSGSTPYGRDANRDQYSRSTGDVRGNETMVTKRDYRSKYDDDNRSSRTSTRGRDHDRDEDWRLVDSMKETRISSAKPPPPEDNYNDRQSRSRVQAYSSEDDYVIVAPSSRGAPTKATTRASSTHRSAIARSDYPEPEVRRRRSRSISFRGSQVDYHDVSERKHERPGAEAQICGPYLRRPMSEFDERSSIAYSSYDREGEGRRPRVTEVDRERERERDRYASQVTYRERDEPYPPQSGFDSVPKEKKRDRSRRRRRRDDDNEKKEDEDDESYYSENIIKKTTTKYR